MKPELCEEVTVTKDFPGQNLLAGDVAVLVDIVPHPTDGEDGAVLEIFNAVGESMSVVTVPLTAIASLTADQVPAVRVRSA